MSQCALMPLLVSFLFFQVLVITMHLCWSLCCHYNHRVHPVVHLCGAAPVPDMMLVQNRDVVLLLWFLLHSGAAQMLSAYLHVPSILLLG